MEEPVPVWRERRGRLSAYRGPAQPPVQPGPGSRRGRCARRTRSRALGGTELHPERHRAGHAQTRARGPRLWLPARARPRSRLLEVFAFAFLPMSLRKMKVVVSRTGAAAVPGEGRRMRRRPAWSAGPGAPAQGEVAAHPGPPGSPEDGQQRNKKMDSLAAGELNASHQPWVPEFVAHWRKTHQDHLCSLYSWAFGLLDTRETWALRKGPEPVPGKDRLLLAAFPAEISPVDTTSVSAYGRAPTYMHKGVKKCVCTPVSKNSTAWLLLGGILQVTLIRVICSSVLLTLCTIKPCSFYLCTFLIKESC
ncbi:uncharacterized protein CARINH isoform X1 [Macaca mulatta]